MFARFFQILAVSAAFNTALIGYTSAADKRRVCSGEWTDMRRIGLSIGDCDLNDISDADLDYVHRRCGGAVEERATHRQDLHHHRHRRAA